MTAHILKRKTLHDRCSVFKLIKPEQNDLLQEVLREGERKTLVAAIEAEVSAFIEQYAQAPQPI